jgi:hypothetical protein
MQGRECAGVDYSLYKPAQPSLYLDPPSADTTRGSMRECHHLEARHRARM